MKSVRLDIEGLNEKETQDKIKNQLEGIIGVQDIFLSAGQTYLNVNYDERTTEKEIHSHLQNNGYNVANIVPLNEAVSSNSLDINKTGHIDGKAKD